ncbi:GGDEF domain-containing protein [Aliiglaciecola litoralis]|uniref:diguanylate cyclase n=1 Tax=Aliiglaciecola litoralis TaxID=582857 RepID=A0ABP3WYB4_9ALTE
MDNFTAMIFLSTLFVLHSVIAFVFLSYVPTNNNRCKINSIRYFQSYFMFASIGYLFDVGRPWLPFELSVFITHLFLISAAYSVVLGISWRYKFHRHIFSWSILLHIALYSFAQLLLSIYFPEEVLYRLMLIYINIPGVFLFALSLFGRFKSDNPTSDKMLKFATLFVVVNVLSIPVFYFGTNTHVMFMNVQLLSQNLVVFVLFSAITFSALYDNMCDYKRNVRIDAVTGLYNRAYFIEQATRFLLAAQRHEFPMSLVLCDIDKFAQIQETLGDVACESAVLATADVIKQATREKDLIAHYGPHEFVILLPLTRVQGASLIAERMRAEIEALTLSFEQHQFSVTASFSVSNIEHHTDINTRLEAAIAALRKAKQSASNQIIQSSD